MSRQKFLILTTMILAVAVFAWTSGDALAQRRGTKPVTNKQVTVDDVATYLGKVPPSEQKAAAKRARQTGLKPGVAGGTSQAPVTAPAVQAPEPGGTK